MTTTLTRDLCGMRYDEEYRQGARNAAFTCLKVRPGETVVLITDEATLEIGAALDDQFRAAGATVQTFVLEDLSPRPLTALPEPIARALEAAAVSCFAASPAPGELKARVEMTGIVNRRRIRHAHMVGITPRIMREGMRADYNRVDALARWVYERTHVARTLTASTPAGTRLTASFSPDLRWLRTTGLITPEKWTNLPGGEVFTAPARVDGVYVVDGVLGDWMAPRYGDMRAHPLTVTIENSRIVRTACDRPEILADFTAYTSTDPNSNRVGELALGVNTAVKDIIGNILQDEKIPGMHLAFGHPYSEHTGADWTSTTHIDIVGRHFDVDVDGVPIMRDSRFLVDDAAPGSPAS